MLLYSLITTLSTIICIIATDSNQNHQPFSLRLDQIISSLIERQKFSGQHPITELDENLFSITAWTANVVNLNTSQCGQQFSALLNGTLQKEKWAMKLIDAWGKPLPSGLLTGNLYWMGNYAECMDDLYQVEDKSFLQQPFDSQYCKYIRDFLIYY